ncbi:MAG: hypothetical protein LUD72_13705 [Bacteroidales bacterium]|nr:hypothetical protein [Bacteroidales bacterium]
MARSSMKTVEGKKAKTLARIDAATTILEKYPGLDEINVSLSINGKNDPFQFIMDVFKHTAGYDYFIQIIAKFIVLELPVLEAAVKFIILEKIKQMLSCSINPIISDDLLREGVVVNLKDIDLLDILCYSPLNSWNLHDRNTNKYAYGHNYYYGCDHCECSDDILEIFKGTGKMDWGSWGKNADKGELYTPTKDMNALIWYVKNKSSHRILWGRVSTEETRQGDDKQHKRDGVLTMEYHERAESLTDAEGGGMAVQTPYNNVLHAFIGNVREIVESGTSGETVAKAQSTISECSQTAGTVRQLYYKALNLLDDYKDRSDKWDNRYKQKFMDKDQYTEVHKVYERCINILDYFCNKKSTSNKPTDVNGVLRECNIIDTVILDDIESCLETVTNNRACFYCLEQVLSELQGDASTTLLRAANALNGGNYREIQKNYYYRHPMMNFNYDYVNALSLFDAKVVAAQLIDVLTGLGGMNLQLSAKRRIVQEEVKQMVSAVMGNDDITVSDCFFTFSNDDYDAMLQKTELQMAGLFTVNGEENTSKTIDAESLMESLNGLSDAATEEEKQTIIEGALTTISKELTSTEDRMDKDFNFGVQFNFLENLLNNLAMVIVLSILSPKVYLLLKINLEVAGQNTNFSLEGFIKQFKNLIVEIIREICSQILKFLLSELMKIIGDMAKEIGAKITIEQAAYYARLLARLIEAFKRNKRQSLDWNMDDVDYADIYDDEEEEEEPADVGC